MPVEKEDRTSTLVFFVNGRKVEEKNVDPETSLLKYLRTKLLLCGTKAGCNEGGCGTCTVMLSKYDRGRDQVRHHSVNACLTPLASLHAVAVTTVEGIGSSRTRLHAVQDRIARAHGSQCGFCTPGIVMSMYTLLRNNPKPGMKEVDEYFTGNLCRCTGYRPILEGFRGLTTDAATAGGCGRKDCCKLRKGDGDAATQEMRETSETTDISHVLYDKEFRPYHPSQDVIFPPELKLATELESQYLVFRGPRTSYFRPVTLEQVISLKIGYPDAKIIVGNTDLGIGINRNQVYSTLINPTSVTELTVVTVTETGVNFGSCVTLTTVEETLLEQVRSKPEAQTRAFSAILEMLRYFGGKQIRNMATIGGCIMTSAARNDLNPLLLAAGTKLQIRSSESGQRQVTMDQNFFSGYKTNLVQQNEVLVAVQIPYTHQNEYFSSFKQSSRRVSAGMRVVFSPGTTDVERLDLSFGGMASTTVVAATTMQKLKGRPWDTALLEDGTSFLLQDLPLSESDPGGKAEYRRVLAVSFFFKFYLSVRGRLSDRFPSVVQPLTEEEERAIQVPQYTIPEGTQLFQKVPPNQPPLDPIGRPITHATAFQQATGEAVYVDDLPRREGEVEAAVVVSSRAHAKLILVDESEALKMEGVVAFVCARDLPEERNKRGPTRDDEEVFASKEVNYVGQLIGLVLAEDKVTAQRAATLVKVEYEDIEPAVITIEDAIREKSWWPSISIVKGDVESAFATSPHILEGELHVGGQEHFYLEPNSHLAVPKGETGGIELFTSVQNPSGTQREVAAVLGLPLNLVTCRVKRVGGGFGGKETRVNALSVPACIAASTLGRPVRLVLDRDEDMLMTGGRHPTLGRWKVSFTSEGLLTGVKTEIFTNGGWGLDLTGAVTRYVVLNADGAYRCENRHITGYPCRTNLAPNTAFRGFGTPQATLIVEDMMSKVALRLGMDPLELRAKNFYKSGEVTHYNQVIERCTVGRCWDEVVTQADYHKRREVVKKFNRSNRYRKRGIAVSPCKFGIGFTDVFLDQAGALVHVYTDGSVLLAHGGTEMGQGLHTKMIQVASRVLKIPLSLIHIEETSTDKVPNTTSTAASISSDINGMAVINACNKIMERLQPYITRNPTGNWEDWVRSAYFDRVSLSATGFYKAPIVSGYNFETQTGEPFNYFCFGAAVTEVEIDCLTGDRTVLRTDIVMDVGESLNPAIDIGQVEGAFIQGIGLYTLEELLYSPEGVMLTRGPRSYKIPGFRDIPKEFNVSLLRGAPNPRAVYSSKGVGEPPLLLAASAFLAIKDAVTSARRDQGLEDDFTFNSPATAWRIRLACKDSLLEKVEPTVMHDAKPWCISI